jgi:hypothetical protein
MITNRYVGEGPLFNTTSFFDTDCVCGCLSSHQSFLMRKSSDDISFDRYRFTETEVCTFSSGFTRRLFAHGVGGSREKRIDPFPWRSRARR